MNKFLYRSYKIGGWVCITTALILILLRLGTPSITIPSSYFSKWATKKLQYPILIEECKLTWEGLIPSLNLSKVQILTHERQRALRIQKLKMHLSVVQLLTRNLVLKELEIKGVEGGLDYQQGVISLQKLPLLKINLNEASNYPIVRQLWIKDANLEMNMNQDHVVFLTNTDVSITIGSLVKINAVLKDSEDNKGAPFETWQLELSSIAQNNFVGKMVAKDVDLRKWQQRIKKSSFGFDPLTMQGQIKTMTMNFDKNHGQLVLYQNQMNFRLGAESLNNRSVYEIHDSQPLVFKDLAVLLDWQRNAKGFDLHVKALKANVQDVPLKGKAKISFIKGEMPSVDMILELGRASNANVLKLFPSKIMDNDLTAWLNNALSEGEHGATTCVVRGNLSEFPFDNNNGVFDAHTELDNLNFNYYLPKQNQARLGKWPPLTQLKTSLHFHNRALFISAEKGKLMTGELMDADAVIPDLFSKTPELIVDTKVASTLDEALKVVEDSPLPENLINTLDRLSLKGPMLLSLGLEIPLSAKTKKPLQVRGLIEVQNAQVSPKGWQYPVTDLKGDISFTQNSIKSSKLSGLVFQMPSEFSIDLKMHSDLKITAKGFMEVDKLQKAINQEISHIKGTTDYFCALTLFPEKDLHAALSITSSLKGLRIEAPYPFSKTQDTENPIELKLYLEPNRVMHCLGKYGDNIHLASRFVLGNKIQSLGAHLHFGKKGLARFREDSVLLIDGDIDALDFPSWKTFLSQTGLFSTSQHGAPALKPEVALNIGALSWYGFIFENEKVKAHYEPGMNQWDMAFDGAALKGFVKIPDNESSALLVDLQKLVLKSMNDQSFSIQKTPNTHPIDIKIKELIWGTKHITDIKALLEPSWKGYFFSNALAKMKESEVSLSGNWDYLSESKVGMTGKIVTKNIHETLNALGLKGTVQKAAGVVDFDLKWQGAPSKIDYPTLAGQLEFNLSQGVIQGMNPGMGRVLSLLNLDNVKRRLNLDFSDVTKDGFVFNALNGKFQFGKGKVSSNKIILHGPSAKVEAFGQADLENQALNGEMIVMPNVTGSLPVAAAIAAGNPAIGAAVWAVDKMFGHKIQEIHRVHYKVLGTWEAPKVEEIFWGLPFESARG